MEVTGKNLLNVCKLLFSLARTDANDCYLSEEGIAGEGEREGRRETVTAFELYFSSTAGSTEYMRCRV